jgi:hypothetical protein
VSDGQVIGSWLGTNGISVPYSHTSGSFVMDWDYTVGHHVDSSVAFNLGSEQQPDYRVIVMDDNAQTVSARLVINPSGQATLYPLWITRHGASYISKCSSAVCGSGNIPTTCSCRNDNPEAIALGKVKGLAGGPHVINGALVFDAVTGQLLADMNIGVTQNENDKSAFGEPEINLHGISHERKYGFEVSSYLPVNVFTQTIPEVASLSLPMTGTDFGEVGQGVYGSGVNYFGYWGQPRIVEKYIDIESNGDVYEGYIKFRDQQHASVLKLIDDVPVLNVATQEEKDVLFDYVQEGRHTRAGNSWRPLVELQALQGSSGAPNAPTGLLGNPN